MPLTALTLNLLQQWTLTRTNVGFKSTGGTDQETFSWAANATLTSTWDELFAQEYTVFASGTAPTAPAAVLASGGSLTVSTTYFYKVTAASENTDGTVSETQGSSEVSVTPTSGNQTASLSWTALAGAGYYNIYRGTSAGSENLLVGTSTTTTFSDTGLAGSSATPPVSTQDYVEFGLRSFTNLVGDSVTATAVLSILVLPTGTGSTCVLSPGTTNGLTWFLSGTTPAVGANPNGCIFHSEDPSGTGQALSSGSNSLRITNGGTAALTATVIAPVSTN